MSDIFKQIPGVEIQKLQETHINSIIELMNEEGWYYYDQHELKRYLKLKQDCFVILKNSKVFGSIFTTNYGNQAWIGNIVIEQKSRGQGLASFFLKYVIDFMSQERQIKTFRLGSVPLAINLYKKLGFRPEAFTSAQEADLPIRIKDEKINLGSVSIAQIQPNDLTPIFHKENGGIFKNPL